MWRSCYHELKALLRRRQFRDIVLGVGSADMLLHGAEALFLLDEPLLALVVLAIE